MVSTASDFSKTELRDRRRPLKVSNDLVTTGPGSSCLPHIPRAVGVSAQSDLPKVQRLNRLAENESARLFLTERIIEMMTRDGPCARHVEAVAAISADDGLRPFTENGHRISAIKQRRKNVITQWHPFVYILGTIA